MCLLNVRGRLLIYCLQVLQHIYQAYGKYSGFHNNKSCQILPISVVSVVDYEGWECCSVMYIHTQ